MTVSRFTYSIVFYCAAPRAGTQGRVVWKAVGSVSEVVKLWVIKRETYGDCLWLLRVMDVTVGRIEVERWYTFVLAICLLLKYIGI